jgi:hypothetical protein
MVDVECAGAFDGGGVVPAETGPAGQGALAGDLVGGDGFVLEDFLPGVAPSWSSSIQPPKDVSRLYPVRSSA